MYPLIGLTGKARSGKDTFAERLVKKQGYVRLAFADTLREALLALNPLVDLHGWRVRDVVEADGWEEAKADPEVRALLQRLGTEAGRDVLGESVWVNALESRIAAADTPIVITDVRFPNEADMIRRRGGTIVRIVRDNLAPIDVTNAQHASETAMDDYFYDWLIANDGDIEELHARADIVARESLRLEAS